MQSGEDKFNTLQGGHISLSWSNKTTHRPNLTNAFQHIVVFFNTTTSFFFFLIKKKTLIPRGFPGPTSFFHITKNTLAPFPFSLTLTPTHKQNHTQSLSLSHISTWALCACKIEVSNLRIWVSVFIAWSSFFFFFCHIWH